MRTALEQVHAQAKIVTTGAPIPDSNMFFGLLSVLHRDAELCSIASGVSEAVLKIARQAAESAKLQMQQAAANAGAKPAAGSAPGAVPGAPQAATAPQQAPGGSGPPSVWSGSICWTITDATQTKREVSTVSAMRAAVSTASNAPHLDGVGQRQRQDAQGFAVSRLTLSVRASADPSLSAACCPGLRA